MIPVLSNEIMYFPVSAAETILTEKVCQTLVQVLVTFSSTSAEICESVLDLLQNHAENGKFKWFIIQ